jgi:predicted HicB family RNase H-like nuclease
MKKTKRGRPEIPNSTNRTMRMPRTLWEKVTNKARSQGTSTNAYVRTLIENDLNQTGEKK